MILEYLLIFNYQSFPFNPDLNTSKCLQSLTEMSTNSFLFWPQEDHSKFPFINDFRNVYKVI